MNKAENLEKEVFVQLTALILGERFTQDVNRRELCYSCGTDDNIEVCQICDGRQTIDSMYTVQVDVLPGMRSGHEITFHQQGHQAPGMLQGDIIIKIVAREHPSYRVEGDHIRVRKCIDVNVIEALYGFSQTLHGLSDGPIHIYVDGRSIKHGEEMRVPNLGMPIADGTRGALYIQFQFSLTKYGERLAKDVMAKIPNFPIDEAPLEAIDGFLIYYKNVEFPPVNDMDDGAIDYDEVDMDALPEINVRDLVPDLDF